MQFTATPFQKTKTPPLFRKPPLLKPLSRQSPISTPASMAISVQSRLLSRLSIYPPPRPSFHIISRALAAKTSPAKLRESPLLEPAPADEEEVPTSGISRPLSEILKELGKRVPDSLVKTRVEHGFSFKYVPWHIVNRILNLHAPEWSGEIRSIVYSADGKSVSVVYRVTLYGTDAEIYREASGTASVEDTSYGDPVQKAEAMAFRRACARLGLGLHLYHEDMS